MKQFIAFIILLTLASCSRVQNGIEKISSKKEVSYRDTQGTQYTDNGKDNSVDIISYQSGESYTFVYIVDKADFECEDMTYTANKGKPMFGAYPDYKYISRSSSRAKSWQITFEQIKEVWAE